MKSRYALHVENWKDCERCPLSETRVKTVLAKGKIPCDLLLVGEAPGESENVLGIPFVGPAGKLLERIVDDALEGYEYRVAYTNIVACIPREDDGTKLREPDFADVMECRPRLEELIDIAKPRIVVAVGSTAQDSILQGYKASLKIPKETHTVQITHPAAILRANVVNRGLMIQKNVVILRTAIEDYLV